MKLPNYSNLTSKNASDLNSEVEHFLKQLGIVRCAVCTTLIVSARCLCVNGPALLIKYKQEVWDSYWEPFDSAHVFNLPFQISIEKFYLLEIDNFEIVSICLE